MLTREQKLLAVGFVAATGSIVIGLDHWADLFTPKILGGLIVQVATMWRALYTETKEP